jgi:triosephosphate isomerase
VGESLEENRTGKTAEVIYGQMIGGLEGSPVYMGKQLVVAYEPVWAIGTGLTATPDAVADTIRSAIRPALTKLLGLEVSEAVRVLYGGSVNPGNAAGFLNQAEIDGALVGGASLKPDSFIRIVAAA